MSDTNSNTIELVPDWRNYAYFFVCPLCEDRFIQTKEQESDI